MLLISFAELVGLRQSPSKEVRNASALTQNPRAETLLKSLPSPVG